jgi:hypothetical protein
MLDLILGREGKRTHTHTKGKGRDLIGGRKGID